MLTKHISSLWVHPDNAANLLTSFLQTSLIIASHHQTLPNLDVTLDLKAILNSETKCSLTLMAGLITTTLFFITHSKISVCSETLS